MPVVTFRLTEGTFQPEALRRLLVESSTLYADILGSPLDRVRAFADVHPPQHVAVAGELVADTSRAAPYFEFLVLAGRPVQQRRELLRGFTDLLEEILGAPRDLIRGRAIELHPDNWAIAGVPASTRRADEIAARART